MSEKPSIAIIDEDAQAREVLQAYVEHHALYSGVCVVCSSAEAEDMQVGSSILVGESASPVSGVSVRFSKPVRMGAIGDALEKLMKKQRLAARPENLPIGRWRLDVVHNVLSGGAQGADIRLTEKEKEILVFLHGHTDQSVSREDLLHAVWGYGEGIETHTLETHIYRLRQKIEGDPAAPEILLTTETGYVLAGGSIR